MARPAARAALFFLTAHLCHLLLRHLPLLGGGEDLRLYFGAYGLGHPGRGAAAGHMEMPVETP